MTPASENIKRRVPLYGPAFKDPATGRDPKEREIPKSGTGKGAPDKERRGKQGGKAKILR